MYRLDVRVVCLMDRDDGRDEEMPTSSARLDGRSEAGANTTMSWSRRVADSSVQSACIRAAVEGKTHDHGLMA
jgi:hypothetical protein